MPFPPVSEQLALIRRGTEQIVPEKELAERLEASRAAGRPLRIKYGIDPTGIDVHLGHTVPLRKMRQFQELGHQAVIIIGNYTALVGDPSGRDQARAKRLTPEEVERNARDYLAQVGRIVDLAAAEVHRNGDWFGRMSFSDILSLCSTTTIAQLLTRDDFAARMRKEQPIYLHECLYPVMQARDSVEIRADVELGGTEQLYAFMLARELQRDAGQPRQIGIMSPILVGTDGTRRMGKSLDNYIGLAEQPYEMIKKIMQLPDGVMRDYFELLTDIPLEEAEGLLGDHPREAKLQLARTIIGQYHSTEAAEQAAARWQREIGQGGLPEEIPVVAIDPEEFPSGDAPAGVLLKAAGLCKSTSEARRKIAEGGAYLGPDKQRIERHDQPIPVEEGLLLWVGKKKFCRITRTST